MNHPHETAKTATGGNAFKPDTFGPKRTPKSALRPASANTEPDGPYRSLARESSTPDTSQCPSQAADFSPSVTSSPTLTAEFSFAPAITRREPAPFPLSLTPSETPFCRAPLFPAAEPATDPGQTPKDPKKLAAHIEFWEARLHWKSAIAAKLREVNQFAKAEALEHCRSEASVRRCTSCGKTTVFWNRCDLKHCPCCNPRLAREKKESVEEWTRYIGQPKHVVLTCRNSDNLTKERVQWFKDCFSRLRARVFCKQRTDCHFDEDPVTGQPSDRYSYAWLGGFYGIEVTKESKGWHLHLHALVDCRFIDAVLLAREWADICGQEVAIVKVKDAREKSYLQEVLKYVVKGDDMAKWSGHDITALIDAFDGVRIFGVFGSLFKRRAEFKAFIESMQGEPEKCECGCSRWEILSAKEAEWKEMTGGIPPPCPRHAPPTSTPQDLFQEGSSRVLAALAR